MHSPSKYQPFRGRSVVASLPFDYAVPPHLPQLHAPQLHATRSGDGEIWHRVIRDGEIWDGEIWDGEIWDGRRETMTRGPLGRPLAPHSWQAIHHARG